MTSESTLLTLWRLNKFWPVLLGLLLLANLALYGVLRWQLGPSTEALERRFIAEQARSRQNRQARTLAETPLQLFRQNQADLARFDELVPPAGQFSGLLKELFALAEQAGLEIDSVNYQPKRLEGSELLHYALQFRVQGGYGQVKRFIFSLEQSPRLMPLEQVSLSGGSVGQDQISLQLSLSTYFRIGDQ